MKRSRVGIGVALTILLLVSATMVAGASGWVCAGPGRSSRGSAAWRLPDDRDLLWIKWYVRSAFAEKCDKIGDSALCRQVSCPRDEIADCYYNVGPGERIGFCQCTPKMYFPRDARTIDEDGGAK